MQIVLIGPTSPLFKGGIVHYTYSLYRELIKKHKTLLISFKRPYPQRFFPGTLTDSSRDQFRIKEEQSLLDWLNPISYWRTYLAIKRAKPEIVIFQWWTWFWALPYFCVLILCRTLNTKIVIIAHNPFDHEVALYKNLISRFILGFAHKIVVTNSEIRKQMQLVWSKKEVVLSVHPIYTMFKSGAKIMPKKSMPNLLFFGHVRPYKGLDILLYAMNELWARGQKVNLTIAGEFWENKDDYLKLVPVKYKPFLMVVDRYIANEEIPQFFSECTAVIIPYHHGSGSGPSKMAITFNKPIIATPVGDTPDLFELGSPGIMLKSNSSKELAAAIEALLDKPEGHYQPEINKIKKALSWQTLVNKIIEA